MTSLRLVWCVATYVFGWPRVAAAQPSGRLAPDVAALRATPGPQWKEVRTPHFMLYGEGGAGNVLSVQQLADSLEDALGHASRLLGVSPPVTALPITVFVTRSAARFPNDLVPSNRGAVAMHGDTAVILLVHNDTIRAFTRNEVMHVVTWRAWGFPKEPWVDVGVALWADGRCQGTTVLGAARDLLAAEPHLRADHFADRYRRNMADLGERLTTYVLAASLVAFIHDRYGLDALRHLYRFGALPGTGADQLSSAWRDFVSTQSRGQPSLSRESIRQRGCG